MIVRIMNKMVEIQSPEPLLSVLRKMKIYFPLHCGGNGTCGKCLIRVREGEIPVTSFDRQCLTEEQIKSGYRLGCKAMITQSCVLELTESKEATFFVPSLTENELSLPEQAVYGVAVDIGTTTLAMALVDLGSGTVCRQYSGVNHQRSFGTDIMARIQKAVHGYGPDMQACIQADLAAGFKQLLSENMNIEKVVIAGNTTMMHLLRGYDCSGLGQYPFTPFSLDFEHLTMRELLGRQYPLQTAEEKWADIPVILFPGISAFIGGDITAGLWANEYAQAERPQLFLDLGTNAEMVLACNGRLLTASAAAGPAFEGGHLSCGVGSVPGAIKDIKIQYGMIRYTTIGRQAPIGICGTGMVAGIAEMLRHQYIEETGLLKARYAGKGVVIVPGKIAITQKDIREFQKAKAAIRTGLEILMEAGDCQAEEIKALHLAGGFGSQIDGDQAVLTGLIPDSLHGKIKAVGNGVIAGLIRYMQNPDEAAVRAMTARTEEIIAAEAEGFMDKYLNHINFK